MSSWAAALSSLLFFWSPGLWSFAVALAVYRVTDIVVYQLCIVLVTRRFLPWHPVAVTRSVLLTLLNFYEITVSYALLYLGIGNIIEAGLPMNRITTPLKSFYYSLVTMATLGYGEFAPGDDRSRLIVILQLVTELVLVLAIIPTFVSHLVDRREDRRNHE